VIDVTPQRAALRPNGPASRVNRHTAHGAEIDHQAAVAHGVTRNTVSASADGNEQAAARCEGDSCDYISGARALRDKSRPPIDGSVPDAARLVELRIGRQNQPAAERRAQFLEVGVPNVGRRRVKRLHSHRFTSNFASS
jgi:hypothetical protein